MSKDWLTARAKAVCCALDINWHEHEDDLREITCALREAIEEAAKVAESLNEAGEVHGNFIAQAIRRTLVGEEAG